MRRRGSVGAPPPPALSSSFLSLLPKNEKKQTNLAPPSPRDGQGHKKRTPLLARQPNPSSLGTPSCKTELFSFLLMFNRPLLCCARRRRRPFLSLPPALSR